MPTCGCSSRKRRKKKNITASAIVLRRKKTITKQRNEDSRTVELERVVKTALYSSKFLIGFSVNFNRIKHDVAKIAINANITVITL